MQVERVGPVAARDLEHVAEARGGDQRRLGALALDQRIDDQRRAMIDEIRSRGSSLALAKQSSMPSTKLP